MQLKWLYFEEIFELELTRLIKKQEKIVDEHCDFRPHGTWGGH